MSRYRKQTVFPERNAPEEAAAAAGNLRVGGYYEVRPTLSGKEQFERALDTLYRRKWIVIACLFLSIIGTAAYVYTRVPEYAANSIVMLNLTRSSTVPGANIPMGDQLFATNARTLSGEIFVIQNSLAIATRVSHRLAESRGDSAAAAGVAHGTASFSPANGDVNAIRITAVSSDPEEAALLANLYAEEYVTLTQEASRTYMSTSRSFLEQQEEQRQAELRVIEERYADYLEQGGVVGLDQSGSSLVSQIAALEAQRDNARVELEMRQRSLQARQDELGRISPQLAQRIASGVDRRIQVAHEKLAVLESQQADIQLHYAGASQQQLERTNLASINEQIRQLQAEIEKLSADYVNEVSAAGGITAGQEGLSYVAELRRQAVQDQIAISGLGAQIEVLNRRIGDYETELNGLPKQSIELARLERSKQHAEQMYQFVVQRLQETRIAEESEPGYAHILRRANVPVEPVRPEKERLMILGVFFGLLFGLGLALVCDKLDNRIYKPDQVREAGYKVIGVVPNMDVLVKEDHDGADFIEQNEFRFSTKLVTLVNPLSSVAEAFRHIRTNIQFGRPDVVVQTILVTSPGASEGKSTTAANLAITMAQAGRRTLLIDADLRRPQQHKIFGFNGGIGLVEMLFSKSDISPEALTQAADGLYVLPAGSIGLHLDDVPGVPETRQVRGTEDAVVINAGELLGSRRMRDILYALRDHFDVIVIDTPPVLAASDAVLLSTQSDATLVVVRAGKTKEGEVTLCMESLKEVGAEIIGTVLNSFDISMAYGGKYKYQRDYYSKYGPYSKYGYGAYAEQKGLRKWLRLGAQKQHGKA